MRVGSVYVRGGRTKAARISPNRGIEIDDFADRRQFPTEGLQTEFQTGPAGFAVQQPGQGQGHHAIESMNADLLIGPVIQGLPADEDADCGKPE
ncbi:MAG: hypothetical protein AUG46_12120 [Acidobacteria bacterium 13_1_20CM_3_58_11]|nr:MAG: hypothetical protein AUG46_12120 [Acidobacteria bacterium 13_1_20CM_3_58_11]